MNIEKKIMRDVFIEDIYYRMRENNNIFFLSADFGSPKLDIIRKDFKDRFINVGIAEQNLINISTGLALEGYIVYAYAIAPFLIMRAYEQIRINLSLQSQLRDMNVNLIGVGTGLSYDVSGPTHHCLEDISIMRTLPNIVIFSPSDWILVDRFVDYSININRPKYMRLDGKLLPKIYDNACIDDNVYIDDNAFKDGFRELKKGEEICLISTGYMTHVAINVANIIKDKIGIIDVFLLPLDEDALFNAMRKYSHIITIEESFINKGGLDSYISSILNRKKSNIKMTRFGFGNGYIFDIGRREYIHKLNNLDSDNIAKFIIKYKRQGNGE